MDELKADGTIRDWKSAPYDWRFSLPDLLNKGAERDGKIYYGEATSTPYIEQTLRLLAASSKTSKVTIVAHSNGGLIAKALLNRLGDETAASLIDKMIMVGAPQSGAPESLGVLLLGHNAGIYKLGFPIVSNTVAREFSQNSPMAYHLLPSEDYLESIASDERHPVASFAGDGYARELAAYGPTVQDKIELDGFLTAQEGGRVNPSADNLKEAEVLNAALINYANAEHTILDAWMPPPEIEVTQIAGWGVDTVAGIEFYTLPPVSVLSSLEPVRAYRPIFTEDGDGTVPVPSALMMASSTNVKRYWVNLAQYSRDVHQSYKHANILETLPTLDFVKTIISHSTNSLSSYISSDQPPANTEDKKLTFFLHSPLTLQMTDSSGNVTGLAEDGSLTENIPDSTYGEFGDVKYVTVPADGQYQLTMHGQENGTFSLDMEESVGGIVTASSTIAHVPTTESTLVNLTISGGLNAVSLLAVDENGDGENIITLTPVLGETSIYELPASNPVAPIVSSRGGSGGASSLMSASSKATATTESAAAVIITATTTLAATTSSAEPVRTNTNIEKKSPLPVVTAKSEPRKIIAEREKRNQNLSQTASVFQASQQSLTRKVTMVLYNGLRELWTTLMRLF